jgi:hypothetical protein
MQRLDHHLTERTTNRAYLMQTAVAHIGTIAFIANLTLGVLETLDGHWSSLLGRLGVAAFTAAVWFSGSFRANLMRQRATEGRPSNCCAVRATGSRRRSGSRLPCSATSVCNCSPSNK